MEKRSRRYSDDGSEKVAVILTHQEPIEERETGTLGEIKMTQLTKTSDFGSWYWEYHRRIDKQKEQAFSVYERRGRPTSEAGGGGR